MPPALHGPAVCVDINGPDQVVLPDPERIDADVLGEHSFDDDIARSVGLGVKTAAYVDGDVAEGV